MEIIGANLIGREDSRDKSGNMFKAIAPETGQELEGEFYDASEADIDLAFALAKAAAAELRRTNPVVIGGFLDAIVDELNAVKGPLLDRCLLESGLTSVRLEAEFARLVGQLNMFAEVVREGSWVQAKIDYADSERTPVPKPDLRRMLIPLGPVAVFGACNFPLALSAAGGDTAAALAAGNPVIVKGHPSHPGTSEIAGRAIRNALNKVDLPEGTFSLLQGADYEVGQSIVTNSAAKAVSFTGSLRGGRAIFDAVAGRQELIPVFAEMGSLNPVFIYEEKLGMAAPALAQGLFQSFTQGNGQFCTKPGIVILTEGAGADALMKEMGALLDQHPPDNLLNAGIRNNFFSGLGEWESINGVERIGISAVDPKPNKICVPATAYRTDSRTFMNSLSVFEEEVFGPIILFVVCESVREYLNIARSFNGQLTATLHGTDKDLTDATNVIDVLRVRAGRLVFNGYPTGVEVCASMQHGGPYPASTDSRFTSIGSASILRFARPVCFQNAPHALLPSALQDDNPLGILRQVDNEWTRDPISCDSSGQES